MGGLFVLTGVPAYAGTVLGRRSDSFPGPTLLYPVTDDIVLGGKDYLEFKWEVTDLPRTDHFDFRLYKGFQAFADNLIYKKQFPINQYPIEVSASLLETNQVYTWVLIQVFLDGRKSDKSFGTFKIIKR